MIDFEQEIEARLAHFQHLTGKGNVKDGNRTLYEIVRLMLGMINQNNGAHPAQRIAPHADTVVEAEHTKPEPEYDIAAFLPNHTLADDGEVVAISPVTRSSKSPPHDYKPADANAPFGYTRYGHPRAAMPPYGLTESGLPRKTPLRQPITTATTTTEDTTHE